MSERMFAHWRPVVSLLALALVSGGCGSHHSTLLQGKASERATVVAGYQSLGAGMAYPFVALQLTKPAGSQIPTPALLARRQAGPTFNALLNLYISAPQPTATGYVINYYTDAAGTQSVGSMTITVPGGPGNNNYPGYPVQVPLAVSLAGGNLPASGTGAITYTGPSGANTMTGTFTLPASQITLTVNLTLNDTLDVGGSVSVLENGATSNVTNVHGNLNGPLTGDVTVLPYGWTGTATLNLLTGLFSVTLNNGLSASQDSGGALAITYSDHTQETVTQPLTASLTGSGSNNGGGNGGGNNGGGNGGGNNGGGNGGGSTVYAAPIALTGYPQAVNASGQIVGGNLSQFPVIWASPSASPTPLPVPTGSNSGTANAINATSQIVGSYGSSQTPAFWSSPSAQPLALSPLAGETQARGFALNASGQIVGYSISNLGRRPVLWQSAAETPLLLPMPGGALGEGNLINDSGLIIGTTPPRSSGQQAQALAWQAPVAPSTNVADPTMLATLAGDSFAQPNGLNNQGVIVGLSRTSSANHPVYWPAATTLPTALPVLAGDATANPWEINDHAVIVGESVSANNEYHAVRWVNGQVEDLNNLIPAGSGWVLQRAFHIGNGGVIIGSGRSPSNQDANWVLVPN